MADNNYVERQRVVTEKSNGSLAFIVGGLVVAVAFIVWLFASGDSWSNYSAPAAEPTSGDTTISIDNTAPAADVDTTAPAADPAPAADADTSAAPAEPAPAD